MFKWMNHNGLDEGILEQRKLLSRLSEIEMDALLIISSTQMTRDIP